LKPPYPLLFGNYGDIEDAERLAVAVTRIHDSISSMYDVSCRDGAVYSFTKENDMISQEAIASGALALFDEAYTGPAAGEIWFTDGDERSGFPGLLASVSAEEASRPLPGGGGLTLASHAAHVVYALSFAASMARGEKPETDWRGSWSTRTVTEAEWKTLVERLGAEAAEIRKVFTSGAFLSHEKFFSGCLGVICHGAWHLGALRQALGLIRAPE
jgi:hypothetical protein